MCGIVRNIQNSDLYEYLGNDKYVNLRTKREGTVDEETARRIFKINVEAMVIIEENPYIKEMIHTLNLKFDELPSMQK